MYLTPKQTAGLYRITHERRHARPVKCFEFILALLKNASAQQICKPFGKRCCEIKIAWHKRAQADTTRLLEKTTKESQPCTDANYLKFAWVPKRTALPLGCISTVLKPSSIFTASLPCRDEAVCNLRYQSQKQGRHVHTKDCAFSSRKFITTAITRGGEKQKKTPSEPLGLAHQRLRLLAELLGRVRRLKVDAHQVYSWQAYQVRSEDGQVVAAQGDEQARHG